MIVVIPQGIPLRYKSGASLWPRTYLLGACSSNARLIRVMGRMRSRVVVTRSNPVVGAIGVFLPQDGGGALLKFLPVHVDSKPRLVAAVGDEWVTAPVEVGPSGG